jgi:hypothetical protein
MRACKRPRDVFKNVPRALPDVIMVRVTGINVHMGLNYDSDGLCGLWCVRLFYSPTTFFFLIPQLFTYSGLAGAMPSTRVVSAETRIGCARVDPRAPHRGQTAPFPQLPSPRPSLVAWEASPGPPSTAPSSLAHPLNPCAAPFTPCARPWPRNAGGVIRSALSAPAPPPLPPAPFAPL